MSKLLSDNSKIKKNAVLFKAFFELAKRLGLDVEEGESKTSHGYDPIKTGNRPLQNALCIEQDCTSFFTYDKSLLRRLSEPSTGFVIRPAPFRDKASRHNEYGFKIYNITPASLEAYLDDFSQILRDSVAYVENPIAGNTKRKL